MGNRDELLPSGADSRNVLSWAIMGYARKCDAGITNREPSRFIAINQIIVECIYLRIGRNLFLIGRREHPCVMYYNGKARGFRRIPFNPFAINKWSPFLINSGEIIRPMGEVSPANRMTCVFLSYGTAQADSMRGRVGHWDNHPKPTSEA